MEERYVFKAKEFSTEEWVQGYYAVIKGKPVIISKEPEEFFYPATMEKRKGHVVTEVRPETICQSTGLHDKNGKLIWENDVVKDEYGNLYKAFWQSNYYQFSWVCVKSEIFQIGTKWDLYVMRSFEIEVISNIFDNPELLESEENNEVN